MERPIAVIGAGLAGSLAALALARRGVSVTLVAPAAAADQVLATGLSYGGMLPGRPVCHWRRLERRHGRLGLCGSGLVLHGLGALRLPLPFWRVDAPTLMAALPAALDRVAVERQCGTVRALEPLPEGGWRLTVGEAGGGAPTPRTAGAVILAAGGGCLALWPALPPSLRFSWAGVLLRPDIPSGSPWLEEVRRGRIVQPRQWRRPDLERQAATLEEERWIVDVGLAPWGEGLLMGQITLVRPERRDVTPPDPARMEERLRAALGRLDPCLASLAATYRQVPVPFCSDGRPLVGPVPGEQGLWAFTGFSGAFALVPPLAEDLAQAILRDRSP